MSNTEHKHRIHMLESLRGLLACWVLFAHIGTFSGISTDWGVRGFMTLPILLNKNAGHAVSAFMTLSGFVISYLIEKSEERYSVFIFRRFFRLFPVFLVCLIVGVFVNPTHQYILANISWADDPWIKDQLVLAINDGKYIFQHILWHLPMLHGIVPNNILPLADSALCGPAATISVEWQFYLIAPFLFLAHRRTFGFLFFSIFVVLAPLLPPLLPSINSGLPIRSFLLTHIVWFYIGISSYFLYREISGFPRPDAKIFKTVLFITLIYLAMDIKYAFGMVVWIVFFVLVLKDQSHKGKIISLIINFLNGKFFRYLGKISFPIYLVHWSIIILCIKILLYFDPYIDRLTTYSILLIAVPVATLFFAHVIHYFIEQPCINYARKVCSAKAERYQ